MHQTFAERSEIWHKKVFAPKISAKKIFYFGGGHDTDNYDNDDDDVDNDDDNDDDGNDGCNSCPT